jgi:hypothetical protein
MDIPFMGTNGQTLSCRQIESDQGKSQAAQRVHE